MKKFLVVMLACAMIFAFASVASAAIPPQIAEFTDIADQSQAAKNAIMKLAVLGVLEGNEGVGGSFRPADTLTRAEFAKIVCYLTGNVKQAESLEGVGSKFTDVTTGNWYTGWVNAAAQSGYFIGDPGGTFRPNANITMNEVITVALRCAGYSDRLGSATGNTTWPANYVNKAIAVEMLDDVTFVGSAAATRADAAIICNAALGLNMVVHISQEIAYALALVSGEVDPDGFSEIFYYTNETEKIDKVFETILHKAFKCFSRPFYFYVDESYDETAAWDYVEFADGLLELNFSYAFRDPDDDRRYVHTTSMEIGSPYYINKGFQLFDLAGMQSDIVYNDDDEVLFVNVRGSYEIGTIYNDNGRVNLEGKSYRLSNQTSFYIDYDRGNSIDLTENAIKAVNAANPDETALKTFFATDKDSGVPGKVYFDKDGLVCAVKVYNAYNYDNFGIYDKVDENIVTYKGTGEPSGLSFDLNNYKDFKFDVTKDYTLLRDGAFATVDDLDELDAIYYLGSQNGARAYLAIPPQEGEFTDHNVTLGRLTVDGTQYRLVNKFQYSDDGGENWPGLPKAGVDSSSFGDAVYAMSYNPVRLSFVAANMVYNKVIGVITKIEPVQVWVATPSPGDFFAQYQKLTIFNAEGKTVEYTFTKDFRNGYNYHIGGSFYFDPASSPDDKWDAVINNKKAHSDPIIKLAQGDMVQLVLNSSDEIKRIDNYASFARASNATAEITVVTSKDRLTIKNDPDNYFDSAYTVSSDAYIFSVSTDKNGDYDDVSLVSVSATLAANQKASKVVAFDIKTGGNLAALYIIGGGSNIKFGVLTAQRVDGGGNYYIINGDKVYASASDKIGTPAVIAYLMSGGEAELWKKLDSFDLILGVVANETGTIRAHDVLEAAMNKELKGGTSSQDLYAVIGSVADNGYNSTSKVLTIGGTNVYITGDTYMYDLVEDDDTSAADIRGKDNVIAIYDKDYDAVFVAVVGDIINVNVPPTELDDTDLGAITPGSADATGLAALSTVTVPAVAAATGYTVTAGWDPAVPSDPLPPAGDEIAYKITLTAASGYVFDTTALNLAFWKTELDDVPGEKDVTATVAAGSIVITVTYTLK